MSLKDVQTGIIIHRDTPESTNVNAVYAFTSAVLHT